MDRCVSPGYQQVSRCQLNAEFSMVNVKTLPGYADEVTKAADGVYNNTRSRAKEAEALASAKAK